MPTKWGGPAGKAALDHPTSNRFNFAMPSRFSGFLNILLAASLSLMIAVFRGAAADQPVTNQPAPLRVTVPKLSGRLTLDGELKEKVWTRAARVAFQRNDGAGPVREPTELRLWRDSKCLYLGWTCTDTDIQATFTNRDSKFWEEEVAEMFVTSGPLERYFELQWNPLGAVFDAIITNQLDARGRSKNFQGDWNFTAQKMRSAVKVTGTIQKSDDRDTKWVVEVALPFSDLGLEAPRPGEVWRANFYRFNRGQGHQPDLLSWSPTLDPSFHQPSRFGYLEFGR